MNFLINIIVFLFAVLICFIAMIPFYFIVWLICKKNKVEFKKYRKNISISLITSVLCNLIAYMLQTKQ